MLGLLEVRQWCWSGKRVKSALTCPSVRDKLALLLPFQEEGKGSVGDGTRNLDTNA